MSKEFAIGSRVRVVALPPYVKTAEPMPMLRPPDVICLGEEGIVLNRRPGGYWGIRFTKGAFLLDSQYIEPVETTSESSVSQNGDEKL
ncbi:regulatory protein SipA [Scytonema sp. NUACC26]|uniref:regulatory protein SipA n=1 Tax=Scytonema sp. NUACC26 TaxID=3140176 RepID=UPI0034DBE93E